MTTLSQSSITGGGRLVMAGAEEEEQAVDEMRMMNTPAEFAEDCWVGLELGPGWEKRLTAEIENAIRAAVAEAVAEERETIEAVLVECEGYYGDYGALAVSSAVGWIRRSLQRARTAASASAEEEGDG